MPDYRVQGYRKNKEIMCVDIIAGNDNDAKIKAESIAKARNCDVYNLMRAISEDFKSCVYLVHCKKPEEELSLF